MRFKLFSTLASIALFSNAALAAGNGWMTDFAAAKKKALTEKKDLLIEFTGSDWCPPCKMLNKNVFSKAAFVKAASEKFVLVALDFPRKKELPAKEKAQNTKLIGLYAVQAFPTILLCDSKGMPYAQSGFEQGGPVEYMAALNAKRPLKQQRDQAIAAANKLEGKAKANALWEVITNLEDVPLALSFDPILKAILAADKSDHGNEIEGIYLKAEMANLQEGDDITATFKKFDAHLVKMKITGSKKQEELTAKLDICHRLHDFNGMRKVIDEIIAIDPQSRIGKGLGQFKPRLDQMEKAYKESQLEKAQAK